MPPCLDVYAWIDAEHRRVALTLFIERYVATDAIGDSRFEAFARVHLHDTGTTADREALADLQRGDSPGDAFSLYVRARDYESATLTVTVSAELGARSTVGPK